MYVRSLAEGKRSRSIPNGFCVKSHIQKEKCHRNSMNDALFFKTNTADTSLLHFVKRHFLYGCHTIIAQTSQLDVS